jgi:hypothetical protein
MSITFTRATKKDLFARVAIYGPSGAGKTFTALRIATGLGGRIAAVCTEHGSMRKYADRFSFDVIDASNPTVEFMIEAIRAAEKAGYATLIIDSLTHAWHELLEDVRKIASARYNGNTHSAWSEGTPRQKRLIQTIIGAKLNLICTMRAKTDYVVDKNDRGKVQVTRVGLNPEQGKGIEYEFDLLLRISQDHIATVEKDRTGKYQDKCIEFPGEEFGKDLAAWLNTDEAVAQKQEARAQVLQSIGVKDDDPLCTSSEPAAVSTNGTTAPKSSPPKINWRDAIIPSGSLKGQKLGDQNPETRQRLADSVVIKETSGEVIREFRRALDAMLLDPTSATTD